MTTVMNGSAGADDEMAGAGLNRAKVVTLTQEDLATLFSEPYPVLRDKKMLIVLLQVALGLLSANGLLVVPKEVLLTLSMLVAGQSGIDLMHARGRGEVTKRGVSAAAIGRTTVQLFVALLVPLFAGGCVVKNPLVETLSKVGVTTGTAAYVERARVEIRSGEERFAMECVADEGDPRHELTCDVE